MQKVRMTAALIALLWMSAPCQADQKPADAIHFPNLTPAPLPHLEVDRLSGDSLYVVHSDQLFLLIASPPGLVSVIEEAGPVKIRGRFVDSAKGIETRTFASKRVCIVEATAKGRVEIIVVPVEAGSADQLKRRMIDVEFGPTPQPTPAPATPTKLFVVVVEETAEAAANRAVLFSDKALADRMKAKGHQWRIVDKDVVGADNQPPADVRRLLDAAKSKTYPQLFLVDDRGQIRMQGDLPKTSAGLIELITKAGG